MVKIKMIDREKVIKGLESCAKWMGENDINACDNCPYHNHFRYYNNKCTAMVNNDAIALLKEQEASIPVSWLKEKLKGHSELSYAITDGISNVLDLWEGR